MNFSTKYENHASTLAGVVFDPEEDMTRQEFADESDINNIVAKYKRTGELPAARDAALAVFQDVSGIGDYQDAVTRLKDAENAFMELPAIIRDEFNHDPLALVDFAMNPDNFDRAVELGIFRAPEVVEPPVQPPQNKETE